MALTNNSSTEDVAAAIIAETARRGYTRDESIACLATGIQESGLRPAIVDATGHVGIYQQDGGYPGRNQAATQITGFLDRLDAKRANPNASSDIWRNIFWLQQRPGEKSADAAFNNGRQAYLTEIKSRAAVATALYNRFATDPGAPPMPDNRPDFNEYSMWSPNISSRGTTKVDLFLLHTQEGDGNADSLAKFLQGNEVSYHYTISQAPDGGVTVVDVVDTDDASWSVLSANSRSINLCFAGSRAAWSRADWLKQSKAIDVAAYIAAQDCRKYGIPLTVNAPPYKKQAGISDHRYVTKILGDGTHTDVGDGFPWDVFAAAVSKYATGAPAPAPAPGGNVPAPDPHVGPADDQLTLRWNMLGGQTLVEALAELRDKVLGTEDRTKPGVK